MSAPAIDIVLTGTDQPVPETRRLVAGELSAELIAGNLRAIRFGGIEVLRAIAFVVRDRDWGTDAPALHDLRVEEAADRFAVRYRACYRAGEEAVLTVAVSIEGWADGSLAFDATAVPEGDFETNRCGFCVLHPIRDLAGAPVTVEHVDGTSEDTHLPDLIEPWQPLKGMCAITHEVRPGLRATCRFEGDTFEMEDQRAWSDASFKTYVRPLALPWPYQLPSGVPQHQAVRLSLAGDKSRGSRAADDDVVITVGERSGTMPRIGLVITPEEVAPVLSAADRLRDAAPQSLLFHFDPTAGHGLAALRGFAAVQALLPAEAVLECAVSCQGSLDDELTSVAGLVAEAGLRLDAVAVSPTVDRQSTPPGSAWPDCSPLADLYAAARRAFPGLKLGGGMFSGFTELNRKRPPVALLDFVTHTTNPIVHAADDRSVMETLEALPFITRSVRAIIGQNPYRIGPSTIGMRHNPYGSRTMDNPRNERICMAREDPRQRGLFAAAWLIGYAARTAEADLDVLTVGALTGVFGLLDQSSGGVHPVFHAARGLAALAGHARRDSWSSDPDRVLGLAAEGADRSTTLWIANVTARAQTVRLAHGTWFGTMLDHTSVADTAAGTLQPDQVLAKGFLLRPYAIARLRSG